MKVGWEQFSNYFSGQKDAEAARDAQDAQEEQIREAMALQERMWNQQRADQAPWLEAGRTSLADLMRLMQSGGYEDMANDPGFQFRMSEGQKALERSAAARGGLNSGGTMKALARYSQGVASDEFGNRYNRLANLAGLGQASAQNLAGHGGRYADSGSNLYGAMGNARSAGIIGQQNATSAAYGRTLGSLMGLIPGGGGGGSPIPQQRYADIAPPVRY